jgi:two-component system, LytTR family, response regulator
MNIRTLIIDDEPHAREGIRIRLARYPEFQVVGECASGSEAVTVINTLQPDLLFLDIQMPEMNGFEVLQKMHVRPQPIVIFVTAFDKYAIQAFECHALDYLLKPIREDRFKEAIQVVLSESHRRNLEVYVTKLQSAVSDYYSLTGEADARPATKESPVPQPYLTRLMIKAKDQISIVSVEKIDWIESAGDYVYVHSQAQKHIARETLVSLEERLDPQKFVRIHRSVIVNIEQVTNLRPNVHGDFDVILKCGAKLKLSRTYRAHFEQITGNLL